MIVQAMHGSACVGRGSLSDARTTYQDETGGVRRRPSATTRLRRWHSFDTGESPRRLGALRYLGLRRTVCRRDGQQPFKQGQAE